MALLTDSKRLIEDIPNKVRDILGIIVNVNLLNENGKGYIEIEVYSSSYPVNYKGEYHYRSGSTKQLLKGTALTEFLLSKTGYKWDAVPVDGVSVKDLDKESFDIFRREALRSGRMSQMMFEKKDFASVETTYQSELYQITEKIIIQGQKEGSVVDGIPMKLADYYWGVVYLYALKKLFTTKYELISGEDGIY